MSHFKHRRKKPAEGTLGFQIAPMIDVVFVILLYFMVMVGSQQKEFRHNTMLPGTVQSDTETDMPDEISIRIEDDGQVYLNDDPVDSPTQAQLPELTGNLVQLKKASDDAKSKVLVTIYASTTSTYQRAMDVMNSLGVAGISSVTFQAGGDE